MPLIENIQAEFHGDKAKLTWVVSLDGKKTQSETYKVLAILEKPAMTIAAASTLGDEFQKQFFYEPLSPHSRSLKLWELPARFFEGLSNSPGAISRKLALPAPDTPHNQIESNPGIEAIELESDPSSQ